MSAMNSHERVHHRASGVVECGSAGLSALRKTTVRKIAYRGQPKTGRASAGDAGRGSLTGL
jgi:hypothetical protein